MGTSLILSVVRNIRFLPQRDTGPDKGKRGWVVNEMYMGKLFFS